MRPRVDDIHTHGIEEVAGEEIMKLSGEVWTSRKAEILRGFIIADLYTMNRAWQC